MCYHLSNSMIYFLIANLNFFTTVENIKKDIHNANNYVIYYYYYLYTKPTDETTNIKRNYISNVIIRKLTQN